MREILFKAKRIDNGEWVEGVPIFDGRDEQWRIIIQLEYSTGTCISSSMAPRIIQNTICQYTGLTDKNGNKIWENDIIGFLDVSQYDNGYSEHSCVGQVLWDEETLSFEVTERISCESYEALNGDCEVIGNIIDNPELLGV